MLDKRMKTVLGALVILSACTDYEEKLADRSVGVTEEVTDESYYNSDESNSDEFWGLFDPDSTLCGTFKDSRDDRVYKAVKIGSQVWMAENLSYDYRVNSTSYGNMLVDSISLDRLFMGRVYTWGAAMDSAGIFSSNAKGCGIGKECSPSNPVRGVCPKGWHVPSGYDYQKLFNAVGGENEAATHLKSSTGWVDYHGVSLSGNDEYHYSVYPGDYGESASFWTSSKFEYDSRFNAQSVYFRSSGDDVSISNSFKDEYKQVRCVADDISALKDTLSCGVFDNDPVAVAAKTGDSKYDSLKNTLTDLRDNQTYKTVTIGTQVWMAENLNFSYEINLDYGYKTFGPIVYKNYSLSGKNEYGRYYTWATAMDSLGVFSSNGKGCGGYYPTCTPSYPVRGVCPKGWHLPSVEEWSVLFSAVGGNNTAGTKLQSAVGSNGGDPYGFSALPAGRLYVYEVSYNGAEPIVNGNNASEYVFWTSSYGSSLENSSLYANYGSGSSAYAAIECNEYEDVCVARTLGDGVYASPVRCLRDEPAGSSQQLPQPKETSDSGVLTDSRDGQTYKFVTIGSQTWMAENLKYKTGGSFCYNDSAKYCEQYGRYYTWASAMDSAGQFSANNKSCGKGSLCASVYPVQGICPEGWHLPSNNEWEILFSFVTIDGNHAKMFKSKSGWDEEGNGTDDYGFSALPAGFAQYKDGSYVYDDVGMRAVFWSSTESSRDDAINRYLTYNYSDWEETSSNKDFALSVRCVRNDINK